MSAIPAWFFLERDAAAAAEQAKRNTDKALAPAMVALRMVLPWMEKDFCPVQPGWVAAGQGRPQQTTLTLVRTLQHDSVHFWITRSFEGSARYGSGDLTYEANLSIPIEMIEQGDVQAIEEYIKQEITE